MSEFTAMCAQLGRDRLQTAEACESKEDWDTKWQEPKHEYPFEWGTCWKAVAEFAVAEFEAEVGFYLDILGLEPNAIWEDHVMLMTPDAAYMFTIARAKDGQHVTPETFNLQFMIGNIGAATAALKERGVTFGSELVAEWGEDNPMRTCELVTPSGCPVKLWGFLETAQDDLLAEE